MTPLLSLRRLRPVLTGVLLAAIAWSPLPQAHARTAHNPVQEIDPESGNDVVPAEWLPVLAAWVGVDPASLVGDTLAALVNGGVPATGPVDVHGKPLPPPLKLPPGKDGLPNEWKQVPGTPDRPNKWVPLRPVDSPGGGQPGGSWDPQGEHWDVDNGRPAPDNERIRIKPDGTIVDHNGTPAPRPLPAPFPAVDPQTIGLFAAIGGFLIAVATGIAYLLWCLGGGCTA